METMHAAKWAYTASAPGNWATVCGCHRRVFSMSFTRTLSAIDSCVRMRLLFSCCLSGGRQKMRATVAVSDERARHRIERQMVTESNRQLIREISFHRFASPCARIPLAGRALFLLFCLSLTWKPHRASEQCVCVRLFSWVIIEKGPPSELSASLAMALTSASEKQENVCYLGASDTKQEEWWHRSLNFEKS